MEIILVGDKVEFIEDYSSTFKKGAHALVTAIRSSSSYSSDIQEDLLSITTLDGCTTGTVKRRRVKLYVQHNTFNDAYNLVMLDQDIGMIQAEIQNSLEHVERLKELVKGKQAEYSDLAKKLNIKE